jgi:hypothetical protein
MPGDPALGLADAIIRMKKWENFCENATCFAFGDWVKLLF